MPQTPAPKWLEPPELPSMTGLNDTRCVAFPGADVNSESAPPMWNETYNAATTIVCTSYNQAFTYPCCQWLGGEARTYCGRTQCLVNSTLSNWVSCMNLLDGELGAAKHGSHLGQTCTPQGVSSKDAAAAKSSARRARVTLAAGVLLLFGVLAAV
ncbi:hypothetical protein CcaverHIS002_0411970 [Cutaneotrichosporon cavernicola]|uniref:Uncharacterized protein n=1 Tax=Cutaneotrichosporon cavernicola TaxID=279322 RepID=A0AA48QWH0_9TREE|nr:uncharacterized protein CcaverHIS019_0411900 [Cutaneotrichosporon cavernicola]BEI84593.1 hypothetical protein CcaverHIS002_0411970 [Cutaneotrichosporon cavernicola]BEI92370.1 hypothetical protein CcaverHIS019_0411900 [Cutaneotrichosporon cavernicola]BEJ00138.1 hypothetical protein CcaverHIS631_0411800 [Cutaneotrichosporon cavernicola]BEJ07910.1 hypothetical protein CcaverHIS641_0411790 [Cutaneotrichosporon cavernicola]